MTSEQTSVDAQFVGPGEGQALWFLRNRMSVKATAATTGGAFGLLESVIAPGFHRRCTSITARTKRSTFSRVK